MILWKRFLKFFTLDGTWNKWSHVFGSWFLLTILIYLLLHARCHEHGKQVKFLNVNEIAVINSIYTQSGKEQLVNGNPPNIPTPSEKILRLASPLRLRRHCPRVTRR